MADRRSSNRSVFRFDWAASTRATFRAGALCLAAIGSVVPAPAVASSETLPEPKAALSIVATSTTTSTSSTMWENPDIPCGITWRLYDPVEIKYLVLSGPYQFCTSPVAGVTIRSHMRGAELEFPLGFRGPATILECGNEVHHSECPPTLDEMSATIYLAYGPDGPLPNVPAVCPDHLECRSWPCGSPGPTEADLCGDANGDRTISAKDALMVLRSAVSGKSCPTQRCDTNRDDAVTAGDALRVLATSVGLSADLLCPAPCTVNSAPL